MIRASAIDTSSVTDAQIGMCHKVFEGSEPVYMVASESDSLVEYKVRYSAKQGFTCTCKSGQVGFSNCSKGYCKHVLWSMAASREERQALREIDAAIASLQPARLSINGKPASAAEIARIEAANERAAGLPASKASPYQVRPFSLLKESK